MIITPFKAEHMIALHGEFDEFGFPVQIDEYNEWAQVREESGPGYSFWTDDRELFCCCGCQVWWEGLGELWLTPSHLFPKMVREVVRYTRATIDQLIEDTKSWHVYADVVADNQKACAFIQHFGFQPTGYFKYFDPLHRDVVRYSKEVPRG